MPTAAPRHPASPPSVAPDAARAAAAHARGGLIYGVGAYLWWGLVPIYFKAVAHVPSLEVLAHRVVWAIALLAVLVHFRRQWGAALRALRSRKTLVTLLVTATLIAVNWFVYIWAIANNQVLQGSLGYFINPLVNVLLGFLFLGERLRRPQTVSVVVAAVGVGYLTLAAGGLPWIALILAASFGFYGLLRKTAKVEPLVGLSIETLLLAPVAAAYLAFLASTGRSAFAAVSLQTDVLLILAGAVTAIPLLWFTSAARRLRLSTLGFLQYLAPSIQFVLALAIYGEPFDAKRLVAFCFIWAALVIYSIDAALHARHGRRATTATPLTGE